MAKQFEQFKKEFTDLNLKTVEMTKVSMLYEKEKSILTMTIKNASTQLAPRIQTLKNTGKVFQNIDDYMKIDPEIKKMMDSINGSTAKLEEECKKANAIKPGSADVEKRLLNLQKELTAEINSRKKEVSTKLGIGNKSLPDMQKLLIDVDKMVQGSKSLASSLKNVHVMGFWLNQRNTDIKTILSSTKGEALDNNSQKALKELDIKNLTLKVNEVKNLFHDIEAKYDKAELASKSGDIGKFNSFANETIKEEKTLEAIVNNYETILKDPSVQSVLKTNKDEAAIRTSIKSILDFKKTALDLTKKLDEFKNEASNPIIQKAAKEFELSNVNGKVAEVKGLYQEIIDKYEKVEQASKLGDIGKVNSFSMEILKEEKALETIAKDYEELLKNPKVEMSLKSNKNESAIRTSIKNILDLKKTAIDLTKKLDGFKNEVNNPIIQKAAKEFEIGNVNGRVAEVKGLYQEIIDKYEKVEQASKLGDIGKVNSISMEILKEEKALETIAKDYEDLLKNPKVEMSLKSNKNESAIRTSIKNILDIKKTAIDLTKKLDGFKSEVNNPIIQKAAKEFEIGNLNSKVSEAKGIYQEIIEKYHKAEEASKVGDLGKVKTYANDFLSEKNQLETIAKNYEDLLKNPKVEISLKSNKNESAIRTSVKSILDIKKSLATLVDKFEAIKTNTSNTANKN